jgi:hypothetical protein
MALVFVECTRQGFGGIFLIFSLSFLSRWPDSQLPGEEQNVASSFGVLGLLFLDTVFPLKKLLSLEL